MEGSVVKSTCFLIISTRVQIPGHMKQVRYPENTYNSRSKEFRSFVGLSVYSQVHVLAHTHVQKHTYVHIKILKEFKTWN